MADDEDVPPLEDMTEVLKKADAIRESRETSMAGSKPATDKSSAKARAKVKKNVTARAVPPEKIEAEASSGDHKGTPVTSSAESTSGQSTSTASPSTAQSQPTATTTSAAAKTSSSGGIFGGMKKGFLFGAPSKASATATKPKDSSAPSQTVPAEKKKVPDEKKQKDDIPYISPKTGKTDSGLTLNEVQQAMSEAKGLLDNQDWITDDLLNKVEKNELLRNRFTDPHFMKALEEFQTNPQAAMEKYKGNTEVEKFLMEFCGLLGDHLTNIGSSPNAPAGAKSAASKPTEASKSAPAPKISALSQPVKTAKSSPGPKIVEITDDVSEETGAGDSLDSKASKNTVKSPKIVEITDNDPSDNSSPGLTELKTPSSASKLKNPVSDIKTRRQEIAEIQEIPPADDEQVKEMLRDPKVMEILLDPRVMNLIQTLKTDVEKGQRIVDTADTDLKEKIHFLMSKGLLQFQSM